MWLGVVLWARTLRRPSPTRCIERIRVRRMWAYLLRATVVASGVLIAVGAVLSLAAPSDFDPTLPPLYLTAAAALGAAARLTWSLDLFATTEGYVHAGAFVPWSAVDAIESTRWAATIGHRRWRHSAMLWAGQTVLGRWYFAISTPALSRLRALWRAQAGPPAESGP